MPRTGIAGSYGSSIFSFLRNLHTVLHSGCINLHSHQQSMRVPISAHPQQPLLLSVFLTIGILVCVKWYLIVVLICISLMANDIEHLFICLLALCISSLDKCLSTFFAHFIIGFLNYWVMCSVNILDTRPLSDRWCPKIFSHCVGYLFTFLLVSFEAKSFKFDVQFYLFILFLLVLLVF